MPVLEAPPAVETITETVIEDDHGDPLCQSPHKLTLTFGPAHLGFDVEFSEMWQCTIIAVASRRTCNGQDLVCQSVVDKYNDPTMQCGACHRPVQQCWSITPL